MNRSGSIFALSAACVACGSSGANTASTVGAAGDAGVDADDLDADGIRDATPRGDVDQDPSVYPAVHHPLPLLAYSGGPLVTSPKVVTVTFVGDPLRDELRQFDDAIVASDWWKTVAHGFGIDPGGSGGYADLPDTVSGKTFDNKADIQPWIQDQVTQSALPRPDASTIYAIYYPASTKIKLDANMSCADFFGYHDSAEVRVGGQVLQVPYAVLPHCSVGTPQEDKDNLTVSTSHELIEAVTDPAPNSGGGWYMSSNDAWSGPQGGETADLCESRAVMNVGPWAVTTAWANDAAQASRDPCQPSPPNEIYFGAAVDTEIAPVTTPDGTHQSDGFVVVKRGESRDVDVVVFSEAPLPSDVQLFVGRGSTNPDPTKLAPMIPGVQATLSRTKAHNGQGSTLTIKAANNATLGDHVFIVRAVLSPNQYHSWPVILRVM
jgi:hypothetical protein